MEITRRICIKRNTDVEYVYQRNFRLRQRITECRLWPVEIMRSVAVLGKAVENKQVRQKIGSEILSSLLKFINPALLVF